MDGTREECGTSKGRELGDGLHGSQGMSQNSLLGS